MGLCLCACVCEHVCVYVISYDVREAAVRLPRRTVPGSSRSRRRRRSMPATEGAPCLELESQSQKIKGPFFGGLAVKSSKAHLSPICAVCLIWQKNQPKLFCSCCLESKDKNIFMFIGTLAGLRKTFTNYNRTVEEAN